jgi:peptidoglycan biosynthesis protein MviN/MurJ (putative lipid II flippase)
VALAINVGLNFLLIPRYASLGATISTLASYVAFCWLRFYVSNLFFKVRYEWGRVSVIAAVGSMMVASFYLWDYARGSLHGIPASDPSRRATLFLSLGVKTAVALAFPIVLLALGFYDERERRRLGEAWQKLALLVKTRRWKEA